MAAANLLEKRSCLNLCEGTTALNGVKRENSMLVLAVVLYPRKHANSKSEKNNGKIKLILKIK